ncbi:MAG: type IV pilus modification PilV family protein [Gemmatimonadota bacterium]
MNSNKRRGAAMRMRRLLRDERGFGLVEAMIAMTILVIGLLAVSGLALATATQAQVADLRSDQMVAGQAAVERARSLDFDSVESGVDTVSSGGREFVVTTTVTGLNGRTKAVSVDVAPLSGGLPTRSFSTVLHVPRSLPAAP